MISFIKKYKYYLFFVTVILLIIGSVIIRMKLRESNEILYDEIDLVREEENIDEEKEEDKIVEEVIDKVFVDIKGAVNGPGVYEIENDKRIIDVIKMAGGLRDDADTSLINLAKKIEDSMVVIIYTEEEVKNAKEENKIVKIVENTCICPSIENDACLNNDDNIKENKDTNNIKEDDSKIDSNIEDKININTASLLDLETLPGIGTSKAKAIIDYRDTNGSFNSVEDIKNVTGIGESLYEKIKDYITV